MDSGDLIRLLAAGAFIAFALVEFRFRKPQSVDKSWTLRLVKLLSLGSIGLVVLILATHIRFPLALEIMEGTVLQHFQRAMAFEHIYTEPNSDFIALSYNPLYYYVAIPAGWVFGQTLFALRFVSIIAYAISGAILFLVVRQKTGSTRAGFITAGLFAAAYDVMDAYLDTAHSDACLLAAVLAGCFLIDLNRSKAWNIAGVLVLVAAFWFKQHGALFAIGGVLFLTWREGIRRSLVYWVIAAVFGPGAYLGLGPLLFGPQFHFFTLQVPSSWSVFDADTVKRVGRILLIFYPVLAVAGALYCANSARRAVTGDKAALDVWHVQFVTAVLSAIMGSLDKGSSDNVFIPAGTWMILVGATAIFRFDRDFGKFLRWPALPALALLLSFAALLYNPLESVSSPKAQDSYYDLIAELKSLDGPVFAPSIGQLESGYVLNPSVHWVALEDMVRGPKHLPQSEGVVERVLEEAKNPTRHAYILSYFPPGSMRPDVQYLMGNYTLIHDYGDRFKPLSAVPHRWTLGWPRYLFAYRHAETPESTAVPSSVQTVDPVRFEHILAPSPGPPTAAEAPGVKEQKPKWQRRRLAG